MGMYGNQLASYVDIELHIMLTIAWYGHLCMMGQSPGYNLMYGF